MALAVELEVGRRVVGRGLLGAHVDGSIHCATGVPGAAARHSHSRERGRLTALVVAAANLDVGEIRQDSHKVHGARGPLGARINPAGALVERDGKHSAALRHVEELERVAARGLEDNVGRTGHHPSRGRLHMRQGEGEEPIVGPGQIASESVRGGHEVPRLTSGVRAHEARTGAPLLQRGIGGGQVDG